MHSGSISNAMSECIHVFSYELKAANPDNGDSEVEFDEEVFQLD